MDRAPLKNYTQSATTQQGFWPANARLVLAVAAGALLAQTGGRFLAPAEAEAQLNSVRNASGIINPEDQRNEIIDELKKINARLADIEKSFDGTIDVNVITMPAQQGNPNNGD
jgi:hypothetical protein